jgi:hypothetical protein
MILSEKFAAFRDHAVVRQRHHKSSFDQGFAAPGRRGRHRLSAQFNSYQFLSLATAACRRANTNAHKGE